MKIALLHIEMISAQFLQEGNSKTTQSYSCLSSTTVPPLALNREEDSFQAHCPSFQIFPFYSGYLSSYFQSRVYKTK